MTAGGEAEAEDGVARLQQRDEHALVGLAARVRLHVGEAAAEQLLGAVDGELLDDVDVLAAAVVAPAGIALGVLVGEHAAGRFEHGRETMFSEAISSISCCWRPSSLPIASATSGSPSAMLAVKNPLLETGSALALNIGLCPCYHGR